MPKTLRRPAILHLSTCALIVMCAVPAPAGIAPTSVAVVVNADSWASMTVANEFIHLREIPGRNVVYLAGLPEFELISVEDFRGLILRPTLEALEQRGVAGQIDCIAWAPDIPASVAVAPDMKDYKFPKTMTPIAAINGLTFLYAKVMASNSKYLDLAANRYARLPEALLSAKPVPRELQDAYIDVLPLMKDEKWAEAAEILLPIAEASPNTPDVLYNTACVLSRLERPEEAVSMLRRAVAAGFLDFNRIAGDDDLAELRERDDFIALLAEVKQTDLDVQPTVGFRHAIGWGEQGEPTENGEHYLLSTVLGWTSGRGNSVGEVVECMRRSAAADGTRPSGSIYYMVNGNIRSRTRQWGFGSAIGTLIELGVNAEAVDGVLPKDKSDVAGLMAGSAAFDWPNSGSALVPGAIAEHLTSFGGVLREGAGQTPITEFIRAGAAGSAGTVTEPYAIKAKFPDPFVQVHYARGCTLAEAFYQSVRGPYQLLILGDPICRPWADIPEVIVEGLEPGQIVNDAFTINASIADDRPVARWEVYGEGRLMGAAPELEDATIQLKGLTDGYHELRVVATLDDAIETKGQVIIPFNVARAGHSLALAPPEGGEVMFGAVLRIGVRLPGAERISLMHNGRKAAEVVGEEGTAEIDTRRLGMGPVQLMSVALMTDGTSVSGEPLEITVTLPEVLPAKPAPVHVNLTPGLRMSIDGGTPGVVESTHKASWLRDLEVEPGQEVVLTGQFSVDVDDMYQFQVRADGPVTVQVDDTEVAALDGGEGWRLVPVALGTGTHYFRAQTVTGPLLHLSIRFGGPGALSVGAPRFAHAAAAP